MTVYNIKIRGEERILIVDFCKMPARSDLRRGKTGAWGRKGRNAAQWGHMWRTGKGWKGGRRLALSRGKSFYSTPHFHRRTPTGLAFGYWGAEAGNEEPSYPKTAQPPEVQVRQTVVGSDAPQTRVKTSRA